MQKTVSHKYKFRDNETTPPVTQNLTNYVRVLHAQDKVDTVRVTKRVRIEQNQGKE